MLQSITPASEFKKRRSDDSQKLQWLKEQAEEIRRDYQTGKLTEEQAIKKLDFLVKDDRSLISRLFGF